MQVDEPRRDRRAIRIYFTQPSLGNAPDRADAVTVDREIAGACGGAGSIDNQAVTNYEVMSPAFSLLYRRSLIAAV